MKRLFILTIVLAVILPATIYAQMAETAEVKHITEKYEQGLTKQPSFSFLDLSRFNLSHSYSVMFFSGGGTSGSQALYNGTLRYQLAAPLTLTLNIGILHDPSSLFGGGRNQLGQKATILPSGWLDWKPSENFHMSIGFETIPGNFYGNQFNNWGRSNYWLH